MLENKLSDIGKDLGYNLRDFVSDTRRVASKIAYDNKNQFDLFYKSEYSPLKRKYSLTEKDASLNVIHAIKQLDYKPRILKPCHYSKSDINNSL